jgi:hypothetical protein
MVMVSTPAWPLMMIWVTFDGMAPVAVPVPLPLNPAAVTWMVPAASLTVSAAEVPETLPAGTAAGGPPVDGSG